MATATEKWSAGKLEKRPDTWTANREWHVIDAATELDAIEATGVQINDAHVLSSRLKCDYVGAERGGFNLWTVRATYSIPTDGEQHTGAGAGVDEDPLLAPPRIRWGRVRESVPVDEDRDGNAITNSAGVPFDPSPQKLTGWLELTITRNEPYFDVQQSNRFAFTINDRAFNVLGSGLVGAGQVLCVDIAPTSEYTATAQYVEVQYVFWIREEEFALRVLDQGLHYESTDSGLELRPFQTTDEDGSKVYVTEPQLLNGSGQPYGDPLASNLVPLGATVDDNGTAVWLTYDIYPAKNFGELNL